ncbi:hypothetical protein FA13DRAFT_1720692 [Coprinellus micaceus]|uniref:Uncharacterized protein n=1 Tax=Coprinellus micaceus TaxID=71717 RepID=A0A4Y7S7J4_COPMI|nr:hypothetical protein FA13DRAFT_1720692 [Coprinellus micaceus]
MSSYSLAPSVIVEGAIARDGIRKVIIAWWWSNAKNECARTPDSTDQHARHSPNAPIPPAQPVAERLSLACAQLNSPEYPNDMRSDNNTSQPGRRGCPGTGRDESGGSGEVYADIEHETVAPGIPNFLTPRLFSLAKPPRYMRAGEFANQSNSKLTRPSIPLGSFRAHASVYAFYHRNLKEKGAELSAGVMPSCIFSNSLNPTNFLLSPQPPSHPVHSPREDESAREEEERGGYEYMHLHFQRRHPSKRVVLPSMVLFIDAAWTIPGLFHDVRLLTISDDEICLPLVGVGWRAEATGTPRTNRSVKRGRRAIVDSRPSSSTRFSRGVSESKGHMAAQLRAGGGLLERTQYRHRSDVHKSTYDDMLRVP